jgi:hypothetical protein
VHLTPQTYNSTTLTLGAFSFGIVGGKIPAITPATNPQRKKRKKECDIRWVFKDEKATKFP